MPAAGCGELKPGRASALGSGPAFKVTAGNSNNAAANAFRNLVTSYS
jgi:hypothetical protein